MVNTTIAVAWVFFCSMAILPSYGKLFQALTRIAPAITTSNGREPTVNVRNKSSEKLVHFTKLGLNSSVK